MDALPPRFPPSPFSRARFPRTQPPTGTELFYLGIVEVQGVIDPSEHIMATQILTGHGCGVHIDGHTPASKKEERRGQSWRTRAVLWL